MWSRYLGKPRRRWHQCTFIPNRGCIGDLLYSRYRRLYSRCIDHQHSRWNTCRCLYSRGVLSRSGCNSRYNVGRTRCKDIDNRYNLGTDRLSCHCHSYLQHSSNSTDELGNLHRKDHLDRSVSHTKHRHWSCEANSGRCHLLHRGGFDRTFVVVSRQYQVDSRPHPKLGDGLPQMDLHNGMDWRY